MLAGGYRSDYQPDGRRGAGSGTGDPLAGEKRIFLIANGAMILIGILIAMTMLSGETNATRIAPDMDTTGAAGIVAITAIVAGAINLALLGFVLYTDETAWKWTCLGCHGLGLLGLLGLVFNPAAAAASGGNPLQSIGQLLLSVWLVTLLYRDIQNRQAV
jgi:hypothetical protein